MRAEAKRAARIKELKESDDTAEVLSVDEREPVIKTTQNGLLFIVGLFVFVSARVVRKRRGRISTAPLCDWILNGRGMERERER